VLTLEARVLLARAQPTIIAVTGSVGKTAAKDAIYAVIKDHVHARKSNKSYNTEHGVPLAVLGLESAFNDPLKWCKNMFDGAFAMLHVREYPKVLVLEMGVDKPGDMEVLTRWITPDVVVLTRFPDLPVHVEHFSSPEEVIAEKSKLVNALTPEGVLVYNLDDPKLEALAQETRQRSVSYSRYTPSDFRAMRDKVTYEDGRPVGFTFTLVNEKNSVPVTVRGSLGIQRAYSYCAAAAVGSLFDVPIEHAASVLSEHDPAPGRMRILGGISETIILDDSYNASPEAAERALITLGELTGVRRRIAVLGDMMELGRYSVDAHKEVGKQAAQVADLLVTVGVRARGIAEGALIGGLSEKNILQYDNTSRATEELAPMLAPGDVILVKGSQAMRLEHLVEAIMVEPERAQELLVRQDPPWK